MKHSLQHSHRFIETNNELHFIGIPASQGISIGKAVVLFSDPIASYSTHIPSHQIPREIEIFDQALNNTRDEFEHIIEISRTEAPLMTQILETYLLILMDPVMHGSIRKRIHDGITAENAINHEFDEQKHFFTKTRDPILRERALDLEHVAQRLLNGIRNRTIIHSVAEGNIVVGSSITPTDIMLFKKAGCCGFATEVGGIASHASILARSLSLPAVIGINEIVQHVENGQMIILDGSHGTVIVNPTKQTLQLYSKKQQKEKETRSNIDTQFSGRAITADNHEVFISANVDSVQDVDDAITKGASGIGLLRSEYLVLKEGYFPSENIQYDWYSRIAQKVYPELCTIRAFDIGSDKRVEGLPDEMNPALGVRGIRFLLKRPDIFKTQLRAVLRASKDKNIALMLPMITNVQEILDARILIEECKQELIQENILFDKHMPIGIMIETPAAALSADKLAKQSDFFSIGTNDLTQYILAADRANEFVADVYDIFHPTVYALIRKITKTANKHGIKLSICGEIAGFPKATQKLIQFGIRYFSVSPPMISVLKQRVSTSIALRKK